MLIVFIGGSGVGGCLVHPAAPLSISTFAVKPVKAIALPVQTPAPATPSAGTGVPPMKDASPQAPATPSGGTGVPPVIDNNPRRRDDAPASPAYGAGVPQSAQLLSLQHAIALRYAGCQPVVWGSRLTGIQTHLGGEGKCLALTFDACGYGKKSQGYDAALIAALRREQVPATLFISGLWADAHPDLVKLLAADPLFEIENHGLRHLPCSVNGHGAYHLPGTRNAEDVVLEVEGNAEKLQTLTGRKPHYFRAGTAMYDDVALAIIADLGDTVAGFSVLGDAGATYSAAQVQTALLSARPGDMVICHMNHPEGETCAGVSAAIPLLKAKGFRFVRLDDSDQ